MNNWKKYVLIPVMVMVAGFAYLHNSRRSLPTDLRDAVFEQLPSGDGDMQGSLQAPKAPVMDINAAASDNLVSVVGTYIRFKAFMSAAAMNFQLNEPDKSMHNALQYWQEAEEAARKFNRDLKQALSKTPVNKDTLALAELLQVSIEDTKALIWSFKEVVAKMSPELKGKNAPIEQAMNNVWGELNDSAAYLAGSLGGKPIK
jgi:hypothetical protein